MDVKDREALCANMLADRKAHSTIIKKLGERPYNLSRGAAQNLISRVYRNFRGSLLDLGTLMSDAGGGHRQFLAGVMFDHAMALRRSISLANQLVENGDSTALVGLEKLQRQYAELFGLLSSGPSIQVGVDIDAAGGARIIVATSEEGQAKSVLARMSKLTHEELDAYVLKHLPDVKAYDENDEAQAKPVESKVLVAQEKVDRMLSLNESD